MKKAIRSLQKRYPSVTEDVRRAGKQLQTNPTQGDVVPGSRGCRKLRVANSDVRKGKSGGYRLIYYLVDEPTQVIHLLFIYAKSARADVPTKELIAILKEADLL